MQRPEVDDEPLWAGRYWQDHRPTTAAGSLTVLGGDEDLRGFDVFLPRPVAVAEVRRVRRLVRPVGWRHLPDAHGRRPCSCPACLQPGTYGVARVRRRFPDDPPPPSTPALVARLRAAQTPDEIMDALWALASRRPGVAQELEPFVDHPDEDVRAAVAETLPFYRGRAARALRTRLDG